ncbi:hypothetical protein D0962_26125 [Leptolyngbyaceae cyanobacterium CCMR0082]|uniref:Uncharacterized protein n=1 Tax=Adonisia turfae CCMR0082 TaxID=2304604 RepID=A0A6M0SCJ2_9CYAN|nr:hypothetical protein [Adonisia turfae]NEZ66199.1 hypothetical protein [Adonisia turfae CCMR0082]
MSGDHQRQQPTVENMGNMVDGSHGSSFESVRQPVESQTFKSQSLPPYSLNLHIDRLTLHGFSALDRDLIGAALQAELARLFTEQGMPRALEQGRSMNQLNGGSFEMATDIPPRVMGTRIAQSIYQGLGHG